MKSRRLILALPIDHWSVYFLSVPVTLYSGYGPYERQIIDFSDSVAAVDDNTRIFAINVEVPPRGVSCERSQIYKIIIFGKMLLQIYGSPFVRVEFKLSRSSLPVGRSNPMVSSEYHLVFKFLATSRLQWSIYRRTINRMKCWNGCKRRKVIQCFSSRLVVLRCGIEHMVAFHGLFACD